MSPEETAQMVANTTDSQKLYRIVSLLVRWLIQLGVTPRNIIKAVEKQEGKP